MNPRDVMLIRVQQDFIDYRAEKQAQYNQRGRSDKVFQMHLDAEIVEWEAIRNGIWTAYDDWKVDAIDIFDRKIDCKFIRKYWNVSREKTLNLIQQRKILDGYNFYEWVKRPNRPFEAGDTIEVQPVGHLPYDDVADNLRKSFKEPDGFYVDVRKLINKRNERGRAW